MGLAEKIANMRYHYHLNCIEANNILNQLGIRSDEKAEKIAAKHVLTVFNDCLPRLGYDVEGFMKKRREEE